VALEERKAIESIPRGVDREIDVVQAVKFFKNGADSVRCVLGECPVWDHRNNMLWWVDVVRGSVQLWDATTNQLTRFKIGDGHVAGFAIPTCDGRT